MRCIYLLLASVCILVWALSPVEALTIKSLTVNLVEDGDAQVDLQYELSLPEQAAVLFQITDIRATLENTLNQNLNHPVTVSNANMTTADLTISGFTSVVEKDGNRVMVMPAFSLDRAETVMKQIWYGPITSPDFSPDVTEFIFPDGYTEYYYNQLSFPAITRTL